MSLDPPKIRRATAFDVPAIMRIEQQSPGASHWSPAEYERILSAGLVLVVETGKAIAGFLCAKQAASEWELENIAVAPEFQQRGIAGELVRSLIGQVRQSDASTVFLEVRESNVPARHFYEKHGFVEVGRRHGYYRSPDEDAVLYRLDLNRGRSKRRPRA